MVCMRCRGLMVPHPVSERDGHQTNTRWVRQPMMWRCLICGDRIDTVILAHRAFTQQETAFERRARVWHKMHVT